MRTHFRQRLIEKMHDGTFEDTGWEVVQYDDYPEMWEPVDFRPVNGPNRNTTGPSKRITEYKIVNEGTTKGKRPEVLTGGYVTGVITSSLYAE